MPLTEKGKKLKAKFRRNNTVRKKAGFLCHGKFW